MLRIVFTQENVGNQDISCEVILNVNDKDRIYDNKLGNYWKLQSVYTVHKLSTPLNMWKEIN